MKVEELSINISDKADGLSEFENQELELEYTNCGGDNYFVLKTNRWAFDEIEELVQILNQFKQVISELKFEEDESS